MDLDCDVRARRLDSLAQFPMSPYADRCIRLRERCEALQIILSFSLAANGVLLFFLARELMP